MAKPKPTVSTEIIPYIFYRDVPAALDWLTRAFGFAETMRTATPNGGTHGGMTLDRQRIMMGQGSKEWRMVSAHEADAATQGIFIYMADVDAHSATLVTFCDSKMTGCGGIRSQLICDELVWDKAIFLQKLAHQFKRRPFVPPSLDQHVEDLDLGVDGAPQIDHPAIDFQIDFVTRKRRQNSNMLSRRDLPAAKTFHSTEDDQVH